MLAEAHPTALDSRPADLPPASPARPHLDHLVQQARACGALPMAVAFPCDTTSIEAVQIAAAAGLVRPLLVGPAARIERAAHEAGIALDGWTVHDTEDDPRAAAAAAVALCKAGRAGALMKGSLHSDDLLAAAVAREGGLRGNRRASHVFVVDLPRLPRPLLFTDCVVNISPDLLTKRDIAQNAIDLAHRLGIARPKVAILSAVETVNPSIPGTVDAAALCKMAERGQIGGATLDGPLAYDNAISAASAHNKGITSAVAGVPDILLVPDLQAGNMLYKQVVYMADAEVAGVVLGMRVPIVLTSRSDSVASRVASCALAVIAARAMPAASTPSMSLGEAS
jgi:phosphate acetyltransferase